MTLRSILILIALATASMSLGAGELRNIVLKDGSVISGEVISAEGGVYTVRSKSLGTVQLRDSDIQSIQTPSAASDQLQSGTETSPSYSAELQGLQRQMIADPQIMTMIMSLRSSPEMQAILTDPDIMRAVQSGDFVTLSKHPKIKKLVENPTVRSIQQRIQPSQP